MSTDKKRGTDTLTLRLSKEDKAALDELVDAERVELAARGVAVSLAQYVRGLIRAAYAARQAATPAPTPAATPAAPKEATPARTPPAAPKAAAAPTEAQVRRRWAASKRTGADLARATGINEAVLCRFRSGKKSMSAENLKRLADELDR